MFIKDGEIEDFFSDMQTLIESSKCKKKKNPKIVVNKRGLMPSLWAYAYFVIGKCEVCQEKQQ